MGAPLLPALLLASLCAAADLSHKFFPECRGQGDTASCHAFASIAVLEASMTAPVRLSEADLFVRVALDSGRFKVVKKDDGSVAVEQEEEGAPHRDIAHALEHGVAEAGDAPWDEFLKAWRTHRDEQRAACARAVSEDGRSAKACLADDESALREYLDGLKGEEGREAREKLLGDPEALARSRRAVKAKLAGLALKTLRRDSGDFDDASLQDVRDDGVCREKGRKQTEALVEQLDAGRPMAVCFGMEGVPGWDQGAEKKKKDTPRHCVAATGYETAGEGAAARKVFKLRNSWVGMIVTPPTAAHPLHQVQTVAVTYDIGEDKACAIHELAWLE